MSLDNKLFKIRTLCSLTRAGVRQSLTQHHIPAEKWTQNSACERQKWYKAKWRYNFTCS